MTTPDVLSQLAKPLRLDASSVVLQVLTAYLFRYAGCKTQSQMSMGALQTVSWDYLFKKHTKHLTI